MSIDRDKQARRPRLADLFGDKGRDELAREWDETQAAPGFGIVPVGHYLLEAVLGNLEKNKKETPAYCVRFRIITPTEFQGQLLFHRFYLTAAALPMSKRDLPALGIITPAQMEQPLPQGLRVEVDVIVKTLDDGRQVNELRNFKTAPPATPEPFAPAPQVAGEVVETAPQVGSISETPVQKEEPKEEKLPEVSLQEETPEASAARASGRKRRINPPANGTLFVEEEQPGEGPYRGERR